MSYKRTNEDQLELQCRDLPSCFFTRVSGCAVNRVIMSLPHPFFVLAVLPACAQHSFTIEEYPEQCSMVHNNLATAYTNRVSGERAVNLELSVAHFEMALGGMRKTRESTDPSAGSFSNFSSFSHGDGSQRVTMRSSEGSAPTASWDNRVAR